MSKDSVKILMGQPNTTSVSTIGQDMVTETWKYLGRNKFLDEFVLTFENGKLESLYQHKE